MISVIILAKNEEKNIETCIKSVSWADEILVIDDNSVDKTAILAKKNKAKVLKHSLNNNFASQRNYGEGFAKGEWILFVDADERIDSNLAREILSITEQKSPPYLVYRISRKDFFMGKELHWGETRSAAKLGIIRFYKKNSGYWAGNVHERFITKYKTGLLKNSIKHYPHQTIKEFIVSVDFYSSLRAKELYYKKKQIFFLDLFLYPIGKFLYTYLLKLGFMDGYEGFIYSFMMSFHSFLVRSKLYLLKLGYEKK